MRTEGKPRKREVERVRVGGDGGNVVSVDLAQLEKSGRKIRCGGGR